MLKLVDIRKTFNPGTVNEKRALNGLNLDLKEGDETTALIEAPGSGAGKAEEACEMIRNYFMGKGFWAEFSENLTFFQLEKMESAFE